MSKPYSIWLCTLSASLYYFFFTCLVMSTKKSITTDEFALLGFKSSITLDPYHMLSNWSIPSKSSFLSSCKWVGVTCDEHHGRVKALNLSNMGLQGTISPQLGNLSFLVVLDLQGNSFHGELPQKLFKINLSIQELHLSNNSLTGEIPKGIIDLTQLKTVNLEYNILTGNILFMFDNSSSLQYLNLGFNNLSGILPSNVCQGLPNLKLLYLFANEFSGKVPKVWRYCKELEDLELSFNNFDKGPLSADIGNLTKLQYLYLSNNNLEGKIFFTNKLIVYLLFLESVYINICLIHAWMGL
ncbi:LRR receptor-like serine/threonine-protein kinase SIK1 [Lathyrus oleraceus]|uniref:LRR receptor-like serine/threonine-protein kinase SIK1 n=1 Tax=Pisum sativum TaxID=3888 RepID=UPI0021CE047A|nr:LRR receptor-like serine/threonine-protein kinase SIK1 [Pisum sativum]